MSNAIKHLEQNGIVYEAKSETHFVVEGNEGFIDYWPTTGKWIDRKTSKEGFGARKLVEFIL